MTGNTNMKLSKDMRSVWYNVMGELNPEIAWPVASRDCHRAR